jgi:hypothetical protein
MANGSSLRPPSNPLHSAARYKPRKRFGFSIADASERGSGLFAPGAMSTLQKYKVKKIDLFAVTLTNSFLGERVGNKLQLQLKKYENSPSNQQKSCVYTCSDPNCGSACRSRGSISIPGGISARCCSADCSTTAANSKILHGGGFRCIA